MKATVKKAVSKKAPVKAKSFRTVAKGKEYTVTPKSKAKAKKAEAAYDDERLAEIEESLALAAKELPKLKTARDVAVWLKKYRLYRPNCRALIKHFGV